MKKLIILLLVFPIILLSETKLSTDYIIDSKIIKSKKSEWIELSHRIEDGLNWRLIEHFNSISKRYNIFKQNEITQNLNLSSFADGAIKAQWIERGSKNLAGRMHIADIDDEREIIYAGSSGGNVWKGTIDGKDWKCLNNNERFQDIRAIKFFNKDNLLLVVKNSPVGIMYTNNEGNYWQKATGLENAEKWGNIKRAIFLSNSILLLVNEWDYSAWKSMTSIYFSIDKGKSFKKSYSLYLSVSNCDIWGDESSDDYYFVRKDTISNVSFNGNIIKSHNFKLSNTSANPSLLKGVKINNNVHLYLQLNEGVSKFYYSSDEGQNWNYRSSLSFNYFETNSFEVSKFNKDAIFFGGVEVYSSYDGGITWKQKNGWAEYYGDIVNKLHADIPSIVSLNVNDNELILISTDGGLYISYDQLKTVQNISLNNLNVSQYYSSFSNTGASGITYVGSQDQGFQMNFDNEPGIMQFEQTISGDYGHLTSSDNGKHLWSVYPGFAMVYYDVNRNNKPSKSWSFSTNENWLWMPQIVADPSDPQSAYIAAGNKKNSIEKLWKLKLNSTKIDTSTINFDFCEGNSTCRIASIAVSNIDPNYIYVITENNSFFISNDKGKTWTKNTAFKVPENHYFYGNTIIPSNRDINKLWILGSNYSSSGAYFSNDNGKTFKSINQDLAKTMIYKSAITDDERFIFAATEAGPYVYSVEKNKWYSLFDKNCPDQTFWSVEYLPSQKIARFVTYGRGIWDFKIEEFTNIVENSDNKDTKINIYYPINLNSNFTLTKDYSSFTKLSLFDLEGKEIINYYNGLMNQGSYQFKLSNNEISNLSRGVYLLTLITDKEVIYKKVSF